MKRTFDWLPNWNVKNELYTVAALDCFSTGTAKPRVRWKKKVWLDQGEEGACTGFGTGHVIASSPHGRTDISNELARTIYFEAQKQDEWPGEAYSGSSVNGAMLAARLQGFVSEWRWCKTIAEIKHALSHHGPMVIGVNWYDGMFEPDTEDILRVLGNKIGGHALMLAGYRVVDDLTWYRLENSWGQTWGDNGGCWISETDLVRLLQEGGEFACPTKTLL